MLATHERALGPIAADPRWAAPSAGRNEATWLDDFYHLVSHLVGWR